MLDLGCGPAHVAAYLRDRGVDAFGVDLSSAMGVVARRLQPGLSFAVADMRALPLRDDAVAGVAAFYSLIHLPRADVPRALTELRRVVGPAGRLWLLPESAGRMLGPRCQYSARCCKAATARPVPRPPLAWLASVSMRPPPSRP